MPGVKGSVLGLLGQVPVYCDWVRERETDRQTDRELFWYLFTCLSLYFVSQSIHLSVSASVSIPCLGEIEGLICNISVAAHTTARADRSLKYSSMLLGRSLLISYATPYHTSCAGLSCEVCTVYSVLDKLILRDIYFPSFAIRNTFNLGFSKQNPAIFMSDFIGMDFEDSNLHH